VIRAEIGIYLLIAGGLLAMLFGFLARKQAA
jgi:hypothetical protein